MHLLTNSERLSDPSSYGSWTLQSQEFASDKIKQKHVFLFNKETEQIFLTIKNCFIAHISLFLFLELICGQITEK
jgi:hypothetical protein